MIDSTPCSPFTPPFEHSRIAIEESSVDSADMVNLCRCWTRSNLWNLGCPAQRSSLVSCLVFRVAVDGRFSNSKRCVLSRCSTGLVYTQFGMTSGTRLGECRVAKEIAHRCYLGVANSQPPSRSDLGMSDVDCCPRLLLSLAYRVPPAPSRGRTSSSQRTVPRFRVRTPLFNYDTDSPASIHHTSTEVDTCDKVRTRRS